MPVWPVMMRMSFGTHRFGWFVLALEKSGVEAVVGTLPKVGDGSRLRYLVEREHGGTLQGVFEVVGKRVLNGLGFERPNDPEANGTADGAATLPEEEEPQASVPLYPQCRKQRTKEWSEVAVGGVRGRKHAKGAVKRGGQCSALKAAGPIGNVVGRKRIEHCVQGRETFRFKMRMRYERQRALTALSDLGFQESPKIRAGADLTVLPGSFQAAGVCKATDRKGRIRELPEQEGVGMLRGDAFRDGRFCGDGEHGSEQKVALCERELARGFANERFAVGGDFVGFGIDEDRGCRVVPLQVLLAN